VISKELVAASTVPLVLAMLGRGESYGYELTRQIQEMSEGQIAWSEGMLYPVLHWMEQQGLIESEWRVEQARKRKYYRIRADGKKALQQQREQWSALNSLLEQLCQPQRHSI